MSKTHYHAEASMIERYIIEESIEFCSEYISKAYPIGIPANSWHNKSSISNCLRGKQISIKSLARTFIHVE